MIAHVVLFNFKKDLNKDRLSLFDQSLTECFAAVDVIERVNVGRRVDIDPGYGRSMGDMPYEFAAVLEFRDRDSLVAYLRHPLHETLGRLFWECCENTIVSEYEMVDGRSGGLSQRLLAGDSGKPR